MMSYVLSLVRKSVDERVERSKQAMQSQIFSHRAKEESLQKELTQQQLKIDRLRQQVRAAGLCYSVTA